MAIELITGRAGRAHVDSSDVRAFNAYVNAEGRYVLHGGGAETESANNLRILPAEILVDGAHIRITGTGEEVTLENGASSYDRIDIVALHYTSTGEDESKVESVALEVIKGTPVDTGGDAQDPTMPVSGTSILSGSSEVYIPYIRVKITGLVPGDPEELLPDRVQMLKDTVSGLTLSDVSEALNVKKWLLDNVFKVGYVWVSYTDESPSGIVGGTWTPITERFPYFNSGIETGGSNTVALTVAQMPSHSHSLSSGGVMSVSSATQSVAVTSSNPYWYVERIWETKSAGSGLPHDNMPAYQTLYAWRRTA